MAWRDVTEAQLELPGPRITYVNQAFTRMTGYQPEEVIGQTPRMFQGPKTNRRVIERMRRRLAQGKTFEAETVNYRKDGSSFNLAWTVAPIFGVNSDIVNWISTQHDVTAQRKLERETLDISAREQQRITGVLHDSFDHTKVQKSKVSGHLLPSLGLLRATKLQPGHTFFYGQWRTT